MPFMRLLGISLLSFLLIACGGGGSIEKEGALGDDSNNDVTQAYTLSLIGYSQNDAREANSVTLNSPLDLRATLKDNAGNVVAGKRITFTLADSIGSLNPSSALTQNDGIATVQLRLKVVFAAFPYLLSSNLMS